MALGLIIGAAVATKIAKEVRSAYRSAQEDVRELERERNETSSRSDSISRIVRSFVNSPEESTTYEERTEYTQYNVKKEDMYLFCEYCDGIIYLANSPLTCPHCGAPISRHKTFYDRVEKKTERIVKQEIPRLSGYYFTCPKCYKEVRYVASDIYRSPSANKKVKAQGYTGHTGEVRCPKCSNFLPHYESNWRD